MIVKGPNLFLRTIRETDLDWLYEQTNQIEGRGPFYPLEVRSQPAFTAHFHETGFWAEDNGRVLICANESETALGYLVHFRATPYWDSYEVGYRLFDTSQSGRGIMTEALALFSYTLFAIKPVHRLELKIVPDNRGSVRVAEKVGYTLEGVAREAWLHRGRHFDMAVYSLLRHEFPATLDGVIARLATPPATTFREA